MHCLEILTKSQNFFLFWVFLQTEITDFPTLWYTSTSEIPTLSYTRNLIKRYPFRVELPSFGHCREYPAAVAEVVRKVYVCSMSRLFLVIFFSLLCGNWHNCSERVQAGNINSKKWSQNNLSRNSVLFAKKLYNAYKALAWSTLSNSDFEIKVPW